MAKIAAAITVGRLPKPMPVAAKMKSRARVGRAREVLATTTVTDPPRRRWPSQMPSGSARAAAMRTAMTDIPR